MTDTEFRQAIMTLLLKADADIKADTQEEINAMVVSLLRRQVRKYKKFWDMFFKVK